MKKALKIIDAVSPCVLWIDEIEKGMSGASTANSTDGGTSPRTFGTFLQWQNDHKTPVFVVAPSNNIDSIPPEYLRKGRFDEIFFVGTPNITERADVFRVQFIRQKLNPSNYDMAKLVEASGKFTGAEIGYSISMAKLAAANQDRQPTTEDILKEISQVIPEAKKNKAKMEHITQRASELAQPASYPEKDDPKEVSVGGQKFRAIQA
jgi:SpoVK/Ycf46/Vps4 family AAA+-type ATPase